MARKTGEVLDIQHTYCDRNGNMASVHKEFTFMWGMCNCYSDDT